MGVVVPFKKPERRVTEDMIVVHFMTQEGQPYGSESRKCDICGVMIPGTGRMSTDQRRIFDNLSPQYRHCDEKVNA